MRAKTIALDPESYHTLRQQKRAGETFSDVVRRRLRPPSKISDLAGALKDEPEATWKSIAADRRADRKGDAMRRRRTERLRVRP
jgi:predicted CopG family antitoxin